VIEGQATARYVRGSVQKAKLVLDLIRGQNVDKALATLQFCRKTAARHVSKVLRSAIANAQQREVGGGDVDRLYVGSCYANQGPSLKRIRAAAMGRAFRITKRTSHLTVAVKERPEAAVVAVTVDGPATTSASSRRASKTAGRAKRKTVKRKTAKVKTAETQTSGTDAKKATSVKKADE